MRSDSINGYPIRDERLAPPAPLSIGLSILVVTAMSLAGWVVVALASNILL
jgi:hypothetical protein